VSFNWPVSPLVRATINNFSFYYSLVGASERTGLCCPLSAIKQRMRYSNELPGTLGASVVAQTPTSE